MVYWSAVDMASPLAEMDRAATSHSGQTLLLIAAERQASLNFIVQLNASRRLNEAYEWLVLANGTEFRNQLSAWYLPINNQLVIAELWSSPTGLARADLMETYRVSVRQKSRWLRVGRWVADRGLRRWDGRPMYERRADWTGLTLRVAANQDPPLISFHPGPYSDVGGYVGAVWKILASILHFNYTARPSVDDQWGSLQEDGSWNGVVGMLQRDEVDAAVTTLLVRPARRLVISFTTGILTLRYRIFVRQSSSLELTWSTYMAEFAPSLWTAIIVTVLVGGAAMGVLCRLEERHLFQPGRSRYRYCDRGRDHSRHRDTGRVRWRDAALFSIAATCQQSTELVPEGLATRLFFWTFYMSMVTLSAAYSATLFSSLAVRTYPLPFGDLEGLVSTGTHRLAVPDASAQLDFFKYSRLVTLQEAYRNHLEIVSAIEEGVDRMIRGENLATFMAYHGPNSHPCGIEDLKRDYLISEAAIGLQMDSPYRPFIDFHLARMFESGILDRLHTRWLNPPPPDCEDADAQSLSLSSVFSAFVFLASGGLLSLLCFVAEFLYASCRHQYLNRAA